MSDEYEVFESDIAIVGMAARLPGADNVDQYWANVRDGVESIRAFSEEELLAAGESPENLRHRNYVPVSAPIPGMDLFDGEFFGFSPKESAIMDPQHRHFLECCWEALEHANHPPENFEGPIGLFAGCGMGSYFYFNLCTNPDLVRDVGMFLLRHTGNDKDFLATRASYLLNLRGPSVGIQTACSTSLVAIQLATQSLLSRECDMALAGGVTINLPHRRGYIFEEGEILSPTGHCHAFDHRAKGTVFGSGAGVVALRRMEDALDDGDLIHAVIRGGAINNDGSSKVNYLAPSVDGQASCMVEAYSLADVDPRTIDFIECHGTGTYLGDPIEVEALAQAFRTSTEDVGFCKLGSVKTNIGHCDTAAGVAALIKTALSLKHAQIPPTLNFEKPNPNLNLDKSPFTVADKLEDWPSPEGHPRRAAVNSLGVGGTNAHLILQEAPGVAPSGPAKHALQLISISARKVSSLDAQGLKLAAHLERTPDVALADVAYTLHSGRRAFQKRRVFAASTLQEAQEVLQSADPRRIFTHSAVDDPSVVFMFPGGGAQYPRMAAGLYETEPVFRKAMDRGLNLLSSKHGIDLKRLLFADPEKLEEAALEFEQMPNQLPGIFLVSYALAELFESRGIKPDALVGHSLGENTAACRAGVLSFEDCLGLVVLRGQLLGRVEEGAMLSVNLPAAALADEITEGLDLAVINAPEVTVISGRPDAIDRLEKKLAENEEVETTRLAIPMAAHSQLLDPILEEFRAYLKSIVLHKPQTPFLSNRSGTWITDDEATSPDYWVSHLRHTVRFSDDLDTLLQTSGRILIEVGPGRTLTSLARQQPRFLGKNNALPGLRHRDEAVDDATFFLASLGRVWASGGDFDWSALWNAEERQRVELPTYAWNHKSYFIEPGRVSVEERSTDLPKLGSVDEFGYRPLWKPTLADPQEAGAAQTWLIFMDGSGVGRRLQERLKARGERVITVHEGDAYYKRSEFEFSISPERGKEGYTALVQDLIAHGHAPSQVVHLWLLTTDKSYRPGSSLYHHHQERGFFSLFFLAQALADESVPTPLHITVIENGMQRVGDEAVPHPDKATVLGPAKVIARELPGVSVKVIDTPLPETRDKLFGGALRMALADPFGGRRRLEEQYTALVQRLEDELFSPPEDCVLALREAKRYTQLYAPLTLEPSEGLPQTLKKGGVYLITGGLGGLGLTMAEHLARVAEAKLVLLTRSALPAKAQWESWIKRHGMGDKMSKRLARLIEVEKAGGEVMVSVAEVTNLQEMSDAVAAAEKRFGKINGVLHTAGVVADNLISLKTQASVDEVFAPKIQGTMVLDQLFGAESARAALDFFILFSSTSAATAPTGQVDYVAANAFLNAYAQSQVNLQPRCVAVQWGIWKDVGMAAAALSVEEAPGTEVGQPPAHPLLERRIRDHHGETVLETVYRAKEQWLLDGHRTAGGHALIPGTGYLEMARAALRASGEMGTFEVEDLFFIQPLAVADDTERRVRIKLRPATRGYSFEVRSHLESEGREGWVLHAQAQLILRPLDRPKPLLLSELESECPKKLTPNPAGIVTAQEKHLCFGPRWRVLRRAAYGEGQALGELELQTSHAAEVGEMGLHPALLDIATGFAMELIDGYESAQLWVPISYERFSLHADLKSKIFSHVRILEGSGDATGFAFFDVTLTDSEGEVLAEVHRLAIKKMVDAVDFTVKSRPAEGSVEYEDATGDDRELSPAELQLARNLERGILPAEGRDALLRILAGPPRPQVVVSSMDLHGLMRQAAASVLQGVPEEGIKLARPDLDTEYVEPSDDVERTLVGFWQELLGVDLIGIDDSFFDLGGHSLIAVRLFAKIRKAFHVDFPISVLFEAPTIARCAVLVRAEIGDTGAESGTSESAPAKPRYTHLVTMHSGEGGPNPPFFLVAGMFGNVLNLRHLAHLIGTDRPFYGLQARGLYGDQKPHETFDEMAEAYIAELRDIQPHGPYFLGGFSGGGITAYEMAQRLQAEGEEVALLVMLDTPLPFPPPDLSVKDRALIQIQKFQEKGPAYVAEWAETRAAWEIERLRSRFEEAAPEETPDEFQNAAIEAAFRAALPRYELKSYRGALHLFRPALEIAFDLGNGRLLNHDRDYVYEDNGWTPYVDALEVVEVPGNHDSMVLEPNVRVLSAHLRQLIEAAQEKHRARERHGASESLSKSAEATARA